MKMLANKCGGAFDLPDKLAEKLQSVRARSVSLWRWPRYAHAMKEFVTFSCTSRTAMEEWRRCDPRGADRAA